MGKLRIAVRLGTCGRCGGKLGNPLTHVCVTRADRPRRRTRTRIRPKITVTAKCPACGKQRGNPLTHVCQTKRPGLRKQLATASKPARPRGPAKPRRVKVVRVGGPPQHPDPSMCRDDDCRRKTCQAWKDGYAAAAADAQDDR